MNNNWKERWNNQSKFLGGVQILLLVLILVGLGLLVTQKTWVPKLTSAILSTQTGQYLFPPIISDKKATTTPDTRPGKIDTGVEGIVTIGPTCPVEHMPPDPKCADKVYPTTLVLATTIIGKNGGVLVKTDSHGYFSHEVAPGTYTLRAQSESGMPYFTPITFQVVAHKITSLNLKFDSGIR